VILFHVFSLSKGQLHQHYLPLLEINSGANLYLAKILLHQPQFAANGFFNPHLSLAAIFRHLS